MKYLFKSLVCAFVVTCLMAMTGFYGACEEIRGDVLRLHILANSDSDEDQKLKLKVRDGLLGYTDELFSECIDKNEALRLAQEHIGEIRSFAEKTVREYGYSYPVQAYVTNMSFDTREYGKLTLPAGRYDAVRIIIGKGEGHNWWCVLFPALCLPSAGGNVLGNALDGAEQDIVSGGDRYQVRFKLLEWAEAFFGLFGG